MPFIFSQNPGAFLAGSILAFLLSWSSDLPSVVGAAATDSSMSSTPTATITGRLQLPDKTPFNMTTKVTLNHDDFVTYTRAHDGTFAIYNVPPGIHLLDVQSTTHHFSQVKIQLLKEKMSEPKCLEYSYPGASKQLMDCAVVKAASTAATAAEDVEAPAFVSVTLTTVAMYDYFEKRSGFSFYSILKNPMILMMVFSVGIMYFMPTMMEGLDPEEKARMKKQMEMQQDPSKMISSLWEGFSGAGASEETTATASPATAKKQTRKIKK
jgi:ER membrane protein complex subunit 7